MPPELSRSLTETYEADYLEWIQVTVEALKQGRYSDVDWEHLIDEIEDMARRERRSLESNLTIVLLYLLKWQFQPQQRSGSWKSSIVEYRQRLYEAFRDSPSLKRHYEAIFARYYDHAVKRAAAETGLPETAFPTTCPYSPQSVLDADFFPDADG